MPLPAMLHIMLHFVGLPLAGAVLFVWRLGLSEGSIFLGAGVGMVFRAVVMKRREDRWSYFIAYFVIGVFLILWGIELLGWATFPRA